MKLNKTDLYRVVAERTGISQHLTKLTINTALECIERVMELDGRISIRDFGTFSLKKMAARRIWNPLTEEFMEVPERMGVRFETGKGLKKKLRKLEKIN